MQKYLFDKNRINNEQKILNHLLLQQRHLKKTLYSYLEKISKDILNIPKHESSETLISCINEIQNIYENTKLNITTILDLKNLLENVSRSKHLSTFDFEKYTSQFFELFDKISNTNIEYYSFMEKLQKYMHLYFSGDAKNLFLNSLEDKTIIDFSEDIIDENIIDNNVFATSDSTIVEDIISESIFDNDSKDIIDELLKDAIFETIPEEIIDNNTSNDINIIEDIIVPTINSDIVDVIEDNKKTDIDSNKVDDIEENKNVDITSNDVDNIKDDSNTDIISDNIEDNNDEIIISDNTDNVECIIDNNVDKMQDNNSQNTINHEESSNNTLINETISINLLKELIEDVVEKAVEKVISDATETTEFYDSTEEKIETNNSDKEETENNDLTEELIETLEVIETESATSDETIEEEFETNNFDEEKDEEKTENNDSTEELIETLEVTETESATSDETVNEEIENTDSDESVVNNNINIIDSNSATHLIEKTLFIFNSTDTAILPYSISELENCFSNNPENYSSIQDIIDKEYTVSLENYRNSSLARYQEAFKLAKEKSDLNLTDSINFARKFVFEEQVTPLIIASCTNVDDLNNYLDCLNNNILNEFNCFKIIEK